MCVMSVWGIVLNEINFIQEQRPMLYITNAIIAVLTLIIIVEGVRGMLAKNQQADPS